MKRSHYGFMSLLLGAAILFALDWNRVLILNDYARQFILWLSEVTR